MPRPAYIVFGQSASIDQLTNTASVFSIVETIQALFPQPGTPMPNPNLSPFATRNTFKLIASWIKDDEDGPTDMFHGEVACILPDGLPFFIINFDDFSFEVRAHRIVSDVFLTGFPCLGTYTIEARLRRVAEQEWTWRQSFSFNIEEMSPQTAAQFGIPINPTAPVQQTALEG